MILALIPIAVILVLMIGFRWGAARAGGAGYLSALVIAILFFGAGSELLAYAHVRALFLSLDVLLIIWAAFLLYRVVDEAGAIQTIGQALPHLTTDKGMQALIIGWVFASFLQGVGGFGVPVAVVAPILVGLGFPALAAVIIPSIGHGWAVTFGSLGSSFQALLSSTGQPESLLGPPAALFLGISALAIGLMVAHAAGGWAAVKRLLIPALLLGLIMAFVQYIVVGLGFWFIASFIGSTVALAASFPLARYYKGKDGNNGKRPTQKALLVALSGYAILIVITLFVQVIPPVRDWLGQVILRVQFPEVSTSLGFITAASSSRSIPIFRHAGASLTYTSILAYFVYKANGCYRPGSVRRILSGMIKRVMGSSVSIVSMIAMAVIMENAGMTDTLARGLAGGVGSLFPIVAPWIGSIGAFMTGSNTNSNVVFGALQMRTAQLLGLSVPIVLAAQTAGAALASVSAPAKVVVGASTAGMAGKEGDVMRKLAAYTLLLVLLISLLAFLAVWLGGRS
ncbi:MAG: L-lactate permease [Chloroflexi bacterium]|nr:MAG: L-lactate permease [Chloroflexota bacterium]